MPHRVAQFFQSLSDELGRLQELRQEIDAGVQVWFAPDFSELYSAVDRDAPITEFRLFPNESDDEVRGRQQATLDALFIGKRLRTLLLEGYADECRVRLRIWDESGAEQDLRAFADVTKEWRGLAENSNWIQVLELLKSGLQPDPQKVATLLQELAPSLVALFGATRRSRSKRLRSLLGASDLLVPDKRPPLKSSVSDDRIREWWLRLRAVRRASATEPNTYHDAWALAELEALNEMGRPAGLRIVLLTRSTRVQEAAGSSTNTPCIPSRMLPGLLEYLEADDGSALLERHLSIVGLVREVLKHGKDVAWRDDWMSSTELVSIRETWQSVSRLGSVASVADATLSGSPQTDAQAVVDVLRRVRSETELWRAFQDRLLQERGTLWVQQELVGLFLTESFQRKTGKRRVDRLLSDKPRLHASWQALPYDVHLTDAEAQKLVAEILSDPAIDWAELRDRVVEVFRGDTSPEVVFAIAKVLATLGEWSLAIAYCTYVQRECVRRDEPVPAESLFLRAVCERKDGRFDLVPESLQLAMDAIGDDPRIEVERGTCNVVFGKTHRDLEKLQSGLAILRCCLQRADVTGRLRIVALNNLVDGLLWLERDETSIVAEVGSLWPTLEKEVALVGNESTWPSSVLDTLATAESTTCSVDACDAKRIERRFQLALGESAWGLTQAERSRIEQHQARWRKRRGKITETTPEGLNP